MLESGIEGHIASGTFSVLLHTYLQTRSLFCRCKGNCWVITLTWTTKPREELRVILLCRVSSSPLLYTSAGDVVVVDQMEFFSEQFIICCPHRPVPSAVAFVAGGRVHVAVGLVGAVIHCFAELDAWKKGLGCFYSWCGHRKHSLLTCRMHF